MAKAQGAADIYLRKGALLTVATSLVDGARPDERGVWTGLTTDDFDAACRPQGADAPDSALGADLRFALVESRIGVPAPDAWATKGMDGEKPEVDARLAAAFGLPGPARLYAGMLACFAAWSLGEVLLIPTKRRRGGRFEGFQPAWQDQHPDVIVPFASSDAELGAAIRVCLRTCL